MTSDCHHAFDPVNLCCALCGIPLRQARMKNGWELLFSSDKPKDTEMTPCPDCKGTGKYQPLMGPPEPCRTCSPPVFSNEDQAMSLASVQDIAEERAAAESVLEQYVLEQYFGSGNGGGVGSLEGTRAVPKATETAWLVFVTGPSFG